MSQLLSKNKSTHAQTTQEDVVKLDNWSNFMLINIIFVTKKMLINILLQVSEYPSFLDPEREK